MQRPVVTMTHYARVNSDNVVIYVTPIPDEMVVYENGIKNEEMALNHLYSTIPDSVEDRWIETSIDGLFRKRYAGIGYIWNESLDAFIPPKPYNSWILNEELCDWEPPIPKPVSVPEGPIYMWDEDSGIWKASY